jgi:uncharacterized membrane protein YkoI
MLKTLLISAATIGVLATAAVTPASAQPVAPTANADLPQAIAAAQAATGGKVLDIHYRVDAQTGPGFDAVMANAAGFDRVRVALGSNEVTPLPADQVPANAAEWSLRADAASLSQTQLSLADAVTQAEQMRDGQVIDARIARPLSGGNSVLAYDVVMIQGGRHTHVVIDADTGQKIADPQPLLQGWTPRQALNDNLANIRG